MGARGNSGVILSQIVRGAAESLARVRRPRRARCARASDAAYRAVRKPVEGTMLTAIRELAEEAEARKRPARRSSRAATTASCGRSEMLPVLAEAGVVDAGAAGLVEIVRGVAAALAGEPLPERRRPRRGRSTIESIHQELSRYRYCTVFVVEGERLDADALEAELEPLGDSLLVVGDPTRAQGARPHRRPRPRALARRRARHDRRRRDREHARADDASASSGCCAPCPSPLGAVRASSPSRRAPATGGCSRASARASSTAGGR